MIGSGHVGLATAVCLKSCANTVVAVDSDAAKVAGLADGPSTYLRPASAT